MKLFAQAHPQNQTNTYVLGSEESREAILIDPSIFNLELLNKIEDNNLYIRYIFITHSHYGHISALNTVLRIYEAEIYSSLKTVLGLPCWQLEDGDNIPALNTSMKVSHIPGHSSDSLLYQIDNLLFTGDILYAGFPGSVPNRFSGAALESAIWDRIFSQPEDTIILPGHGPPDTVGQLKKSMYQGKTYTIKKHRD